MYDYDTKIRQNIVKYRIGVLKNVKLFQAGYK